MVTYVVNHRTGEVHRGDCKRRISAANRGAWNPAKRHLTPGVIFCPQCLPDGAPPAPSASPV